MPEVISEKSSRELLTELVRCGSVNPAERKTYRPPYGEARLVRLLAERLKKMGGAIEQEEVLPGRPNLWAKFRGRDSSRSLLLDAHTDTVAHENMTIDPFGASIRDGRLYGRGACDTKGPMASMLLALEAVLNDGCLSRDVVFAATCDEENGGRGVRRLIEHGVKADFAVVAEPTDLKLVHRHKGIVRANITMHGKAAHSSTPELGDNAIYRMNRVLRQLETHAEKLAAATPDHALGTPTLAVVTIHGGTASNIIPDACAIQIDRRLLPGEDGSKVRKALEDLIQSCVVAGGKVTVEWTQNYPPLDTDCFLRDAKDLEAATRSVTGTMEHGVAHYGTHAGFYAQAGIPGFVFGPGSIANAHTADESIDLQQVVTGAEILRNFLSM